MDKMSYLYSSITNDNKATCDICHFAKQKHIPFTTSLSHALSNFELLHFDIWGPLSVSSLHGHRYFLTIVDDHSRFFWIILLKSKAEVAHHVQSFIKMIQNQFHVTLKFIRSDNGPKFMLSDFYASCGIIHQKTCVETPQQNARVERKHQHILIVGKALLFQSKLPSSYWFYAILHAVFLIIRITAPILQNQSPFQVLYNKIPDISSFKVFGCLCYASSLQVHRTKLHSRARKSIFLGYKSGYKGFTLLDIHSREILISRHVIFHEHILPYPSTSDSITSQWKYFSSSSDKPLSIHSEIVPVPPPIIDDPPIIGYPPPNNTPSPILHVSTKQSTRTSIPSSYLQDYIFNNVHTSSYPITDYISHNKFSNQHSCFVLSLHSNPEPKTFTEENKFDCWRQAMQVELSALASTGTWKLVDLLDHMKHIGCRWIYKVKHNADGFIERYKARLVAKGYNQIEGFDFFDTYSLVAKMTTVRLVLALASLNHWNLHKLDVNDAFLRGDSQEDVYMTLPPGVSSSKPNQVCKLLKSFYGLKQASRKWYDKLTSILLQ